MKKFLYGIRRNDWLHFLVLVLLSGICSIGSVIFVAAVYLTRYGAYDVDPNSQEAEEIVGYHVRDVYRYIHGCYYRVDQWFGEYSIENIWVWIIVLLFILGMLMLFYLMVSAGYHKKQADPYLQGMELIPYDLYLAAAAIVLGLGGGMTVVIGLSLWSLSDLIALMGGVFLCSMLLLVTMMVTAAKMKTETLVSGTLIVRLFRFLFYLLREIPYIWRSCLLLVGVLFLLLVFQIWVMEQCSWGGVDSFYLTLWMLLEAAAFIFGMWTFIQINLIRKKAHSLAEGDLEETGCTGKLLTGEGKNRWYPLYFVSIRSCLEDLNRVSDGMNAAVEEKMKSERFQTELITNVSHDIKTPLTSIINYLDFLSQEEKKADRSPERVEEYIEVLDRQSVRLRKLIEDLIEASKASTGSLKVIKEPCELGIFLQQVAGEYEDRLERTDLQLHLALPEESVYVEVDGRHLSRVIENLLQNVCKYAMPGTRVYLQLQKQGDQASISMKNISASELNIPAEELMQRFVRGDRSRHTEGSGLGLSIARSLTELQGGRFYIEIDGDLFKTNVEFPLIDPALSAEQKDVPYLL